MNKTFLLIASILLIGTAGVFFQMRKTTSSTQPPIVPLPTTEKIMGMSGKETVENFFQRISSKEIPEAIALMSVAAVSDESAKQAWGVQFNAFTKLSIKSIEPSLSEEWTEVKEQYKVTMDVTMSDASANAPIPYYGYEQGTNIRWVILEKEQGMWKVAGISTGP